MNVIGRVVVVTALWCSGCASAPSPVPSQVEAWPETVADTCPKRKVSLFCFRKPAIRAAMEGLIEPFRACHRPGAEPVTVMLTVETRGGSPSCVARSPRKSETGRCLAKTVARHLVIPNSPDNQRCGFRYPVRFE